MKAINNEDSVVPGLSSIQEFLYKFFISSGYKWVRHAFVLTLFYFIFVASPNKNEYQKDIDLYIRIIFVFCLLSILYFNMYVLIPKFLLKKHIHWYVLSVLLLGLFAFILVCIFDSVLNKYRLVPNQKHEISLIMGMITFLIFFVILIASSTAIKLFQSWMKSLKKLYHLQKINFQHELGLLKSQINPHFLFNTLNNVHILIESEPKRASDMVLHLSDLLRYQIYDCAEEKVFLSSDISFIKDFLTLETSRRDDFSYEIKESGENQDVMLAPMLFIPFVENAVKHNSDTQASSYVKINIQQKNDQLIFSCLNSKPANPQKQLLPGYGGIGLANIRRRLNLLYPDCHVLKIIDLKDTFYINLTLKL